MIELQALDYRIGAQTFTGFVADGSRGRRVPGILVGHEGPGLTAHPQERAQRLAALGYVAFAMDLYGERDPPLERAKELVRSLRADRRTLRARATAGLEVLTTHPHVDASRCAAIGFCFGGMAVLELVRAGADLRAVVGFHADLTAGVSEPTPPFRGQVLVCLGAADPIVDAAQRAAFVAEMAATDIDWQLHLYGGVGHSFTNRDIDRYGFPGFAYDAAADRRSWRTMRVLLAQALGHSDDGGRG